MYTKTIIKIITLAALVGCAPAPIKYSTVIVKATQAVSEAEVAGASCTQVQLDALSPETKGSSVESGTQLASTESTSDIIKTGDPVCAAPFEYYMAVEYLKKAREEVGYSEYQVAIKYAKESKTYANKARDIALNQAKERGR